MRARSEGVATVATVTPIAVARDSRSFKQAASLARFGMRSLVVEGEASVVVPGAAAPAFELISIGAQARIAAPAPASRSAGPAAGGRPSPRAPWRRAIEPAAALYANRRWNRRSARALPSADLYVVHGWSQLPAVWRRARREGAAILYDAHDSYFERYPPGEDPEFASDLTRRMFAAREGRYARAAAGLMTSSEGIADLLERRLGRRPDVVLNYPDARTDADPGADVRAAAGLGPDEFLLVSVGNAKAGMDVEAGIRALALLPEHVHLALVGGGIEPYRARASELGLEQRVHVLGPVAPDRVNRFVAGADAGVILYYPITADFEVAIPNRLFHAIAAGLPVLYPDLPGIASVAGARALGPRIDSRDPASIAAGTRELVEDAAARERYRANAERAARELSWERQEPKLEGLILAALADGRPGREAGP